MHLFTQIQKHYHIYILYGYSTYWPYIDICYNFYPPPQIILHVLHIHYICLDKKAITPTNTLSNNRFTFSHLAVI